MGGSGVQASVSWVLPGPAHPRALRKAHEGIRLHTHHVAAGRVCSLEGCWTEGLGWLETLSAPPRWASRPSQRGRVLGRRSPTFHDLVPPVASLRRCCVLLTRRGRSCLRSNFSSSVGSLAMTLCCLILVVVLRFIVYTDLQLRVELQIIVCRGRTAQTLTTAHFLRS